VALPFLLSVPHAGLVVPPEVTDICTLSRDEIARDGDVGAAEIYLSMEEHVYALATTDIARAIVDLNRPEDDRGRDGVVKTHTCWDVPIYRETPSDELIEILLKLYYRPYHKNLSGLSKDVIAAIDCHTMAAVGPPVGPDPGMERPPICLSNGEGTCPEKWLLSLAEIIEKVMGISVSINNPFKGGYTIRRHAVEVPWLQIELSRESFLSNREKGELIIKSFDKWHTIIK